MRMFSIFHKLEECVLSLKGIVNIGGKKPCLWLLLSFNVIFALHKFKSLEKC